MKKRTIVAFSIILVLILAVSIAAAVIFIPRKITGLIDVDHIESVEFKYYLSEEKPDKVLTERELEEFKEILSDVRYKIRFQDLRCIGPLEINIQSSDSYIVLKTYFVTVYDKKGGDTIRHKKITCDLTRFLDF